MKIVARSLFRFLARRVLLKYKPLVIGVAGSVGKTATKEAIAAALQAEHRRVRKTEGSFNAEIGVPVTILRGGPAPRSFGGWLKVLMTGLKAWLTRSTYPSVLVLELGADHPGDLQHLLTTAAPTIGVLTSTAPEHLEYFGGEEQVIAEESLIVRTLPASGTAIINIDDANAPALVDAIKGTVMTYGWGTSATIRADVCTITRNPNGQPTGLVLKVAVDGSVIPVAIPGVLGRHQAYPILAAVAVARVLGDDILTIAQRLTAYQLPAGRMRVFEGINGSTIIDDSYNASPAAVQAAIVALDELEMPGKKYLVLGQMSELGSAGARWHDQIGQELGRKKIAMLVSVGPLAQRIGTAAITAGWTADQVHNVATAEAAAALLRSHLESGDAVLLKGSRYASRLEKAVALLLARPERDKHLLVGGP